MHRRATEHIPKHIAIHSHSQPLSQDIARHTSQTNETLAFDPGLRHKQEKAPS